MAPNLSKTCIIGVDILERFSGIIDLAFDTLSLCNDKDQLTIKLQIKLEKDENKIDICQLERNIYSFQ